MTNGWDETPGGGVQVANLAFALLIHGLFGLPWLIGVTAFSSLFVDHATLVWGGSGFALWALGTVDAVRRRADLGAAWGAVLRSWLWILGGPVALAIVAVVRLRGEPQPTPEPCSRSIPSRSP